MIAKSVPLSMDLKRLQPKTLRKGTRSCLQCRRRKVRCRPSAASGKCIECLDRKIECISQHIQSSRTSPVSASGNEDVQTSYGRSARSARAWEQTTANHRRVQTQETKLVESASTATLLPTQAPLYTLLNDERETNSYGPSRRIIRPREIDVLRELKVQIPDINDLKEILAAGEYTTAFWSQAFPAELADTLEKLPKQQTAILCGFIYTSVHSQDIPCAAKCILCLLLQMQQLKPESKYASHAYQQDLLNLAERLLSSDEGLAASTEGVESLLLLAEFYICRSEMMKVWLTVRKALSSAHIIGLHKQLGLVGDSIISWRQRVWMQLWQMDRGFSMLLGLPSLTTDDQYPQVSTEKMEERFLYELGLVMGRITQRDQRGSYDDYKTTLDIDEQLQQAKLLMDQAWEEKQSDMPFSPHETFHLFSQRMRFYKTRKLLHLPYLLKAYEERHYEFSRLATIDAAKELIHAFRKIRNPQLPFPKMCDIADFEAFGAAMTLVVDMVNRQQGGLDDREWDIVSEVADDFERVAVRVNCAVAGKGSQVLRELYDSRRRFASSNVHLSLDIPYFGKITIRRIKHQFRLVDQESSDDAQLSSMASKIGNLHDFDIDGWLFPYSEDSLSCSGIQTAIPPVFDASSMDSWSWVFEEPVIR